MKSRQVPFFLYWRVENVQFWINSIGHLGWLSCISNFPRFHKNVNSLELWKYISENSSPKGSFWRNKKNPNFPNCRGILHIYWRWLLKTLLLSLAVSDVGVGLIVQPFYISLLVKWLQQNNVGCNTAKAFYIIAHLFFNSSFSNVVAVSVDRFLAIHLHLRYQELVTHKRVVAVVISIWLFSAFVSLLVFWFPLDIYSLLISVIGILGLIVTTMVYIRIYLALRRHKNQIKVQQVQQVKQTGEFAKFSSNIKSSVGVFYVYIVFLVCYLPYLFSLVAPQIKGPSIVLKRFALFSLTLICLNSSFNPVIYYWKMGHIRHAVINMLRNMSLFKSRASQ